MPKMTPKQAIDLAKERKAAYVDLKFMDFLGIWQHFAVPDQRAQGGQSSRKGSASTARRSAAGSRSTRPTCWSCPTPRRRSIDPFIARADALADLQHRRPDHQGALLARPAQHRAEGRGVPEVDRHRRHRLLRAGGRVLHLRRRPLRPRRRTTRFYYVDSVEGHVEHRARGGRPNLGYKPRHKEGLLPGPADRLAAGPPHRDGAA